MSDSPEGAGRLRKHLAAGDRVLVVVAGPNGAGKTTFVGTFLKATGLHVVNPDHLARALAPDAPETVAYEAAQLADTVRRDLLARGASFCMETVFSDSQGAKLAFLRDARAKGFIVFLIFIGLETSELSLARVIQRVEDGGHDVPDEKLIARFPRIFRNLREAIAFVDHVFLFDNSSAEEPYRFAAEYAAGRFVRRGKVRPAWAAELPTGGRS
jgi:predicted ABC-type ATPase